MGSAKHMRNNGEQINIHGHDNYQMPGDYKQMGDKNQNQSLGAYKLVGDQPKLDKNGNGKIDGEDFKMMQPGKISGGAAAYMRQSYGADKIGDEPETAAEKAARLKAANDSRIRSKADDIGNFRYERSIQQGGTRDEREGLIGGTASNMATSISGAVRDLDQINPNLSTNSQSDIIDKATKISGFNTDKLHNQYTSRSGGSYDHMKDRASLSSYGKRGGGFMSQKEMQAIGGSGKSLNEELNAEKDEFARSNQFHEALKMGSMGYDSEGKHLTLKQQFPSLESKSGSGSFANLSTPSKQEFNSLIKKVKTKPKKSKRRKK